MEEVENYDDGDTEEQEQSLLQPSADEETPPTKKSQATVYIMAFLSLISSTGYSAVVSSLWPYMKKMDPTISETALGWFSSAYCIAQLASSVFFGYWIDRRRAAPALNMTLVWFLISNIMYAYAEPFGKNGLWVILAARILMGISSGYATITRVVVARLSTPKTLTKQMSFIAMGQAAGMFVGPAMQALTIPIGTKAAYISAIKMSLNIYTVPSYVMCACSILGLVLLYIFFEENDEARIKSNQIEKNTPVDGETYEPIDMVALITCMSLFFVSMATISITETISSPILLTEYALSNKETVTYGAILMTASGVIATSTILSSVPLAKRFTDRVVIFAGTIIMLIGYILYLPWGPGYPKVMMPDLNYANGTLVGGGTSAPNIVGCHYEDKWCMDTPKLQFIQYIVGTALSFAGFPLTYVVTMALYAKIVGPYPQGKYMGWLSCAGGASRVLGPIYVSYLFKGFGPRWMAVGISSVIVVVVIAQIVFWKRIIPYYERYPKYAPDNEGINRAYIALASKSLKS